MHRSDMRLLTYQIPDEIAVIAHQGEYDEFDLDTFLRQATQKQPRNLHTEMSFKSALTIKDFDLLVSLGVFNATNMNQAVFAFRRYENSSLSYTVIDSHPRLSHYGLYDTVVAVDEDLV